MSISAKKKNKREKTISIADIMMVVGFLALAFTTFMGSMLLTGQVSTAIIITLIVIGISVLAIWGLFMAKKQYNNRSLWMVAEFLILAVFVVGFMLLLTVHSRHFFYIHSQNDNLYQDAVSDKATILGLFDEFEERESHDISSIEGNLRHLPVGVDLYAGDDATKKRLSRWKGSDKVKPVKPGNSYTNDQLNKWAGYYADRVLRPNLLQEGGRVRAVYENKLDSMISSIQAGGFNYAGYYRMSKQFADIYNQAADKLTALSHDESKYEVKSTYRGEITTKLMPREYKADSDRLMLRRHFSGESKYTAAGWWWSAAILIFVLMAYFCAPRSRRVTAMSGGLFRRKKNITNDGGIDIC